MRRTSFGVGETDIPKLSQDLDGMTRLVEVVLEAERPTNLVTVDDSFRGHCSSLGRRLWQVL